MSVTAAASAAAATTTSTNSTKSLQKLGTDFNSFLTLLTTQLKNQSPTDPVDANQFTQQLVQFAGVQQQVQGNATLEKILAAVQGNQVSSAASYVGTTIQATGSKGALVGGKAQFGYDLPLGAGKAEVSITNSAGQVIFNGIGSVNRGSNLVLWDGKNSFTGRTEPDGVYSISVKATDANGKSVAANPFTVGKVDSASIKDGTVILNIGALEVEASKVISISNLTGKTS
jgi:flagellar basal-body rod modification protein FlgD